MSITIGRRWWAGVLFAALTGGPALVAQDTSRGLQPGERKVDPEDLALDKNGVWTLHFRYKPPRIKEVDGFDKAGKPVKQTVWYLWYQVYNRSGEPVYFTPEFELVTRDRNTTHLDEPQPYVFDQLKKFEDPPTEDFPNGRLNLLSTIEISRRPVPPSKPDAFARTVSGLAIWTDVTERAAGTNKFSVYVTGLSNGVATEQSRPVPPDTQGVTLIKRKALRLDFVRRTDDRRPELTDIRPDTENGKAETWLYRTTTQIKPKGAAAPPANQN